MKKYILLILIILGFFFSQCKQPQKDEQKSVSQPTKSVSQPTKSVSQPTKKKTSPDKKVKKQNREDTPVIDKPIHLTKALFLERIMDYEKNPNQWIYKGNKPCIIDFYADWCGPCRIASPILEELAKEYAGKIIIYKVDTEKERELAATMGIRSLPTFFLCPMTGKPKAFSGIGQTREQTKKIFKEIIEKELLNTN